MFDSREQDANVDSGFIRVDDESSKKKLKDMFGIETDGPVAKEAPLIVGLSNRKSSPLVPRKMLHGPFYSLLSLLLCGKLF